MGFLFKGSKRVQQGYQRRFLKVDCMSIIREGRRRFCMGTLVTRTNNPSGNQLATTWSKSGFRVWQVINHAAPRFSGMSQAFRTPCLDHLLQLLFQPHAASTKLCFSTSATKCIMIRMSSSAPTRQQGHRIWPSDVQSDLLLLQESERLKFSWLFLGEVSVGLSLRQQPYKVTGWAELRSCISTGSRSAIEDI